MTAALPKILFIINPGSGKNKTDWKKEIETYFEENPSRIELIDLPNPCQPEKLQSIIKNSTAGKVVAVGGDGTVKLVADALHGTDIPLGILPAGSANGMAKEFAIPDDPAMALDIINDGEIKRIHLVRVNKEICIHLSDVGFNAFVVKKFQDENIRGMWGYIKAAWKVLWSHSHMQVSLQIGNEKINRNAVMVVIANASRYGNGVVINPEGSLYDELFEVVIIKKVSFIEIFKMRFSRKKNFHPEKTELFQTESIIINSRRKMHFQIDGEYKGKVKTVEAEIIKNTLFMITPPDIITEPS